MDRSKDWLAQAERNLQEAKWSSKEKFYEVNLFFVSAGSGNGG